MCRFLAYAGDPVALDTLLVAPPRSLIAQSLAAREAKTIVNADGCGIGWYGERPEPGVYRGILPAWSDANLASLCRTIRAGQFVAHVRSATSGEVALANCHPFACGPHLFMHNGQIGGYDRVRRRIDALIPDAFFPLRRGTGDSEALFLIALGHGLAQDPARAFALTLGEVAAVLREAGETRAIRFAAILSDGATLRAVRWASDGKPPGLYRKDLAGGVVLASEPFDETAEGWSALPAGSLTTLHGGGMRSEALTVQ